MSTILDALRKAQAKHEEDDAEDVGQTAASDGAEAPASAPLPETPITFDDAMPADRVASAKRPSVVAAVAVGLVGLVLGVGAARTIAGKLLFRGSEEPARVAANVEKKDAEPAHSKKSAAADVPAGAEKHAQHEGHAHGAHASKGENERDNAAADGEANAAAEHEPGLAPDGSAPGTPVPAAPELAVVPEPQAPTDGAPPGPLASTQPLAAQLAPQPVAPFPAPAPAPGVAAPAPAVVVPPTPAAVVPTAPGAAPVEGQAFGAPGEPVQTAAAVAPASMGAAAPGEPAAGTVLDAPPSGSPEVSLLFIKWSHDVLGRVASLRGPGGKLLLVHEGDIVEGMRVSLIRADAVELQWRGSNFLLYAAR